MSGLFPQDMSSDNNNNNKQTHNVKKKKKKDRKLAGVWAELPLKIRVVVCIGGVVAYVVLLFVVCNVFVLDRRGST